MKSFTVSESFKKRADSAAYWEAWVGAVLSRAGLFTVHHPFTVAGEVGRSIASYGHTWDLDVSASAPNSLDYVPTPVEVKSVNLTFHHVADYPFGAAIVCSQASFVKKWPGTNRTGRDFLFVSRDTGSILWLPMGTKVELGHEVRDPSRNETYRAVKADRMLLSDLGDFVDYVHKPWPEPRDSEPR